MKYPGYPQTLSTQWKTYTGVIFEDEPCIFEIEHLLLSPDAGVVSNLIDH